MESTTGHRESIKDLDASLFTLSVAKSSCGCDILKHEWVLKYQLPRLILINGSKQLISMNLKLKLSKIGNLETEFNYISVAIFLLLDSAQYIQ